MAGAISVTLVYSEDLQVEVFVSYPLSGASERLGHFTQHIIRQLQLQELFDIIYRDSSGKDYLSHDDDDDVDVDIECDDNDFNDILFVSCKEH